MPESSVRASINSLIESTPGASIASIGLSLALFAYESQRMSSFQTVEAGGFMASLPTCVALVAFLIGAFLIYRARPLFRLHRSAITGFVIAGAYTLATLLVSGDTLGLIGSPLVLISKIVIRLCGMLILLCWAESLLPLGAKRVAMLFAFSLVVLGLFNVLTAFMKVETAHIIVATFPLISMASLYWFKDRSAFLGSEVSKKKPNAYSSFHLDQSLMFTDSSRMSSAGLVLLFLAPLMFCSFIFGHIHFSWVPAQDGSLVSLSVQLAAATGTAIAGILILLLILFFWGRRKMQIYIFFVLPIIILTLYVSSLVEAQNAYLYVAPLNIAQKMVFVLIWLAPFLIPNRQSPMLIWCTALLLYQTGKALSISVSGVSDPLFYTICVLAFICLLFVLALSGLLISRVDTSSAEAASTSATHKESVPPLPLFSHHLSTQTRANHPTKEPCQATAPHNRAEAASRAGDGTAETDDNPDQLDNNCHRIAYEYHLTRREEEVLQLLAEAMNAQSIAETLVVSTSTVKSHMRNIYAKLNVHTQNELLILVHRR